MTNELMIPGARPTFASDTEALAEWDFGGSRIPTLEVTAEVIRAVIGDQVIQETEGPVQVVVLGKSAEGRIFYPDTYDPAATPKPPECYSIDGLSPAPNAVNPQANSCNGCPQNVKGSSPTKADSKACRYRQHVAVIIPGTDTIFRLRLSATGMFGDQPTRSGHLPFKPYGQRLLAAKATPEMVITEIKRDLSLGNIRSVFSVPSWLETTEQYNAMRALTKSPEVAAAIDLTISGTAASAEPFVIPGQRPQLAPPASTREPTARVKPYAYALQDPKEIDTVDTYWLFESFGAPANTEMFCVVAGEPLPDYATYGEVTKSVYDTYLAGVAEEAARKQAEAEAEAARTQAEAEAARKQAEAVATPSPRTRNRTRIEKELQGDALPVGKDFPKDPDGYTDALETFWQSNQVPAHVFAVTAGDVLPDPEQYKEVLGRDKAEALFKEVTMAKQAAAEEHKAARRSATAAPASTSKRRSHNAKAATSAEATEAAEAPTNRGSARTSARTSATTLSTKLGTLDD